MKNGRKKPSETLKRLLALEKGQQELRTTMDTGLNSLEQEVHAMRMEMNDGLAAIVHSIEKLHGAIDRVAEVSGRIERLETRIEKLEARP